MNLSNNAARHPLKNNRIQFLLFIVVVSVLTEVETVFKCGIRPTERARERTSGSSNIKLVKRVVGGRQSKQGISILSILLKFLRIFQECVTIFFGKEIAVYTKR